MRSGRGVRHRRRSVIARVLAAAGLVFALAGAPMAALAAGPDDVIVTIPESDDNTTTPPAPGDAVLVNAQLRWGLNAESGGGGFAPGTCNFLSAGIAGDSGGPVAWTDGQGADGIPLYRTQDGHVRIEKPTADGRWTVASTANRCTDSAGNRVSTAPGSTSGNQVVIDGGTGSRTGGVLEIRWTGSFTVVFYSGMTYWSISDPVLLLDADGNGQLTGSASGYGADMNDTSRWERLEPRQIVLAEIRSAPTGAKGGFVVTPQYLGATVDTRGGTPQVRSGSSWGAFPQSFVDFQQGTGQHSYWFSSGGSADAKKPASPVYVSYDAAAPVSVEAPAAVDTSAAAPSSRPGVSPPVSPTAAVAALPALPGNIALVTQPQLAGLVPVPDGARSPLLFPLLASGAALSLGVIAVLSMLQRLPWQRRFLR